MALRLILRGLLPTVVGVVIWGGPAPYYFMNIVVDRDGVTSRTAFLLENRV